MKETEWIEGLDHLDQDLVAQYVKQKEKLEKRHREKALWVRFGAIAACFLLILGTATAIPKFRDTGDSPTTDSQNADIPSVSTMVSGNKITGKQELIYGDPSSGNEGEASMIAPGFYINTVVHANVIEVLPDSFYEPGSSYRYLVARLSVVESVRGEGVPSEIFLQFPYYASDIFDGYETFLFSLNQIGTEHYMLINETKHEVTYFSHMFAVQMVNDLGYGSVIAFNDGKVDASFYERANHFGEEGYIASVLKNPAAYDYPVGYHTTIKEAKENILALTEKLGSEGTYVSSLSGDFFTAEDIFFSEEGKEVRAYLTPSETNVFMQRIYMRDDRIIAEYTRIINGFKTDEIITVNGYSGENGNVQRQGESYSEEDLGSVPDIGSALSEMDLSEIKPPHTDLADGMYFKYATAVGVYRKVDGNVYGVIRILWFYTYPEITNGYIRDDCYYLYGEDGNGKTVERDELRNVIGDDSIIAFFSYNQHVGFDK